MNRKERRASFKNTARAGGSARISPAATTEELFAAAIAHHRRGEAGAAQDLCHAILVRDPKHLRSLVLLGAIAHADGRNKLAVKLFGQALALDGTISSAHEGIALAYQTLGRRDDALRHFTAALELGLSGAETLIKQQAAVAAALKRLVDVWPRQLPLAALVEGGLTTDPLLVAFLRSQIVTDLDLEHLLTALRRALLQRAVGDHDADMTGNLTLFAALAQQCFINDYAFALDEGERVQFQQIEDRVAAAIKNATAIAPLDLIVAASYQPLHRLPNASLLLDREWQPDIDALLNQQIREPLEEAADRDLIPVLTPIEDTVSRQVQDQYEENPYPRWTTIPPITPTTIADYVRDKLGFSLPAGPATAADILIAGCGTGSHSIDTGQRFAHSNVLAVDISRTSLAYARRKTRALGLTNIEYGQADILKLGSLTRRFDLIEAVGVLHHLAEPQAGWRELLRLLRPHGLMLIGLYSALARRDVLLARSFIAERGYRAIAEDIRACRQDMIRSGKAPRTDEFASISGCRDLFFNVMEHQFTIPQIGVFLKDNELDFLGFQLPAETLAQFRRQNAEQAALRDLARWDAFEKENPHTFSRMYYFWVQKRRSS